MVGPKNTQTRVVYRDNNRWDASLHPSSNSCSLSMACRSKAPGWLCWQCGLSQLELVPSVGYLYGRWTTLTAWLAKSSVRETEQDRSIQHGNSYLAKGMDLACGTQFEHMPNSLIITMYWTNSQAIIRCNINLLIRQVTRAKSKSGAVIKHKRVLVIYETTSRVKWYFKRGATPLYHSIYV